MASTPVRLLLLLGTALLAVAPAVRAADPMPEDVRFQTETLLTGLPQPMHLVTVRSDRELPADATTWSAIMANDDPGTLPAAEIARFARETAAAVVAISVVLHEQLATVPAQLAELAAGLPPAEAAAIAHLAPFLRSRHIY